MECVGLMGMLLLGLERLRGYGCFELEMMRDYGLMFGEGLVGEGLVGEGLVGCFLFVEEIINLKIYKNIIEW